MKSLIEEQALTPPASGATARTAHSLIEAPPYVRDSPLAYEIGLGKRETAYPGPTMRRPSCAQIAEPRPPLLWHEVCIAAYGLLGPFLLRLGPPRRRPLFCGRDGSPSPLARSVQ